ncbi:MAG: LysR family transcriptional regulator [Steroidobacteraceae bacterium]
MVKRVSMRQTAEPDGNIEIRQLRAFVTLIELGRVTHAARALGLAQSTVSEALAALERRLGAPVVSRRRGSADPAGLTSAGRALLPHARKVLAAVEGARLAVDKTIGRARAHVVVVANESISTYSLPVVLVQLRKRWPDTRFTVSVARAMDIRDRVARGKCDVGLLLERSEACSEGTQISPARTPTGSRIVLDDLRLVVFARASHPLQGRPVGRESMAPYPLLVSEAAFDFREFVNRYMSKRSTVRLRVESAGSVEGVKKSVSSETDALGLLPAFAVAEEVRQGRFVTLDLRPPPPRMRLRALFPKRKQTHPALGELFDMIGRSACADLARAQQ